MKDCEMLTHYQIWKLLLDVCNVNYQFLDYGNGMEIEILCAEYHNIYIEFDKNQNFVKIGVC